MVAKAEPQKKASPDKQKKPRRIVKEWPEWQHPEPKSLIALAKAAMQNMHLLHSEVIQALVEDNNRRFPKWQKEFAASGLKDYEMYFWKNSPVAFPGIRRKIGKETKKSICTSSLCLDDNSYPKQILSFLLRGTDYVGMTDKNPIGFQLAHLLDHKDYRNRCKDEVLMQQQQVPKLAWSGLFTSTANIVYISTALLDPTDSSAVVRAMLRKVIHEQYDKVCNILPYNLQLKVPGNTPTIALQHEQFIKDSNGRMKMFLEWRAERISELLEKRKQQNATQIELT